MSESNEIKICFEDNTHRKIRKQTLKNRQSHVIGLVLKYSLKFH